MLKSHACLGQKTAVKALGLLKVWYMLKNSSFQPRQQLLNRVPGPTLPWYAVQQYDRHDTESWAFRVWKLWGNAPWTAHTVAMVSLWYHLWQKPSIHPGRLPADHLNQTIILRFYLNLRGCIQSFIFVFDLWFVLWCLPYNNLLYI